jgi:hypothetical protein
MVYLWEVGWAGLGWAGREPGPADYRFPVERTLAYSLDNAKEDRLAAWFWIPEEE